MAAGSRRRDPGRRHLAVLRTAGRHPPAGRHHRAGLGADHLERQRNRTGRHLHAGRAVHRCPRTPEEPPRLAGCTAAAPVLHRAAGVVQDLAHRDRRRQPLPVVSRRRDDLAGGRTRRRPSRCGAPTAATTRCRSPSSSPAKPPTCWRPAMCCAPCTCRPTALRGRTAFRKLAPRRWAAPAWWSSAAGHAGRHFVLSVTAATVRPYVFRFDTLPDRDALRPPRTPGIPDDAWTRDAHGDPDWRRAVTLVLAEQIRGELACELTGQRPRPGGRPAPRPVPAHLPARARPLRGQEGLRRRRLRGLLGAARRRTGALLRVPGVPRRGPRGHHGRRPRHARRPAPRAAPLRRRGRVPVRLLHGRHGHHRVDADRRADGATCPSSSRATSAAAPATAPITDALSGRGQHREVRRRRCGPVARRTRRRPGRHRHRAVHHRLRAAGPAAPGRAGQPARARPDRLDRHHRRRGHRRRAAGAHPPRQPAGAVLDRPPRTARRRPRRHPRARRHRALRRAAGRRGRRRQRSRSPKTPAGQSTSSTRCCPRSSTPRHARAPGAPLVHGDKGVRGPHRRPVPQPRRRAARRGRRRRGGLPRHGARGGRRHAGSTAARPARAPGDARLHRLARRPTAAWCCAPARRCRSWSATSCATSSGWTATRCGCSPAASAAASAASRRCSPRTSSRWRCCALGAPVQLRVHPHRPVHHRAVPAPVPGRRDRRAPTPTGC